MEHRRILLRSGPALLAAAAFALLAGDDARAGKPDHAGGRGKPAFAPGGSPDEDGVPGNSGNGRPGRARGTLEVPEGGPIEEARGWVDVKFFPGNGGRPERSWLRIRAKRLEMKAEYSLWCDDGTGALVECATFTTRGNGNVHLRLDTKHGDELPGGASSMDLGAAALEIRDADGNAVLVGEVPSMADDEEDDAGEDPDDGSGDDGSGDDGSGDDGSGDDGSGDDGSGDDGSGDDGSGDDGSGDDGSSDEGSGDDGSGDGSGA